MDKITIEKTVDSTLDKCLEEIQPLVSRELHPNAFADEYGWLRVQTVFDLQNKAIRKAMKTIMIDLLSD